MVCDAPQSLLNFYTTYLAAREGKTLCTIQTRADFINCYAYAKIVSAHIVTHLHVQFINLTEVQ